MKRSDLVRAFELEQAISGLETALRRCGDNTFSRATIVIQEKQHGQTGTDGKPQQAQSNIDLSREQAEVFLRREVDRLTTELMRLGVSD